MAAPTNPGLITAEEFFLLPEPEPNARQELVRGQVITLPLHGGLRGVTCSKVGVCLENYVERVGGGTAVSNNTGIITERNPDTVRGPDLAFWSKGHLSEVPVGYFEVAPDLAVEVLSASNVHKQVMDKLREYFKKGVRLVWVISPEDRTLTIYRNADEGRLLHETATVTGEDVLAVFECRVSEMLP